MRPEGDAEKIYRAALQHSNEERPEFIAVACGGDQDLRRDVESLLAQGASVPTITLNACAKAGAQLGPYRIEAVIGEGGMGIVYRALDTKLNRPVAIKVVSGDTADAAARRRFAFEAKAASSLNHPHIVTVYDAGEWNGEQYLITEYVDGGTLRDWARGRSRTWQETVELLTGAADALATAHAAGILHRDIKPANILITRSGYAKLADFGLAKLAEDAAQAERTQATGEARTIPGMLVGTIGYMSPEQASGRSLDSRKRRILVRRRAV